MLRRYGQIMNKAPRMLDPDDNVCSPTKNLLARWQAFSELQQRAFAFLAAEALATGEEFEKSTEGAAAVLTRIGGVSGGGVEDLQAETWAVVHKLQSADRSRQGLEQVASVLNTLKVQHTELVAATSHVGGITDPEAMLPEWIDAIAGNVSLADWRRRLVDALNGREPTAAAETGGDELF